MADNKFLREQLELLRRKQTDINVEWQDVADFRGDHYGFYEHRDTSRKGSKIFYEYLDAGWIKDPEQNSQTTLEELERLKRELYKIQTEKLELNRWRREDARDELILEKICHAIENITPLSPPTALHANPNERAFALCFGDTHYGCEFELKGLYGEILNAYSPEIFEERMWALLHKVEEIIKKENIEVLHVFDFGDSIDGLLRVSQLWKLRYGVIESSIKYAEFISNWLNKLTENVNVKFQMVIDGNHSQLRLLDGKKNSFKDENMSKVILAFIKERLKNNPNFEVEENPTGMIFDTLVSYNILGTHGEFKDDARTLREFSQLYGTKINYLISGHLHHKKVEEVGQDIECIRIPSIIGVDDFGLSLRKASNASAKLLCFEEDKGIDIEYNIKLN